MEVNTRTKLMGLWVTLMFLYIYCDFFALYRPGYVEELISGKLGPFEVSQGFFVVAGVMMIIPALMIPVNLFLKQRVAKLMNIIVGGLYACINIWTLGGQIWVFYWIYVIVEASVIITIVFTAVRWRAC